MSKKDSKTNVKSEKKVITPESKKDATFASPESLINMKK